MENPTPHDQDDSRSMSEKSVSDQGLTKQTTTNSATHVNGQLYDSTPTTVRGEQSTGTPAMLPPPRPNFKATPTSAQPSSHSQQGSNQDLPVASSEKKRGSGRQRTTSSKDPTQETTKPVTRKRSHEEIDRRPAAEDSDDQDDESHDEEANDEFKEPANAISPFDWEGLQQRYHDQMRHCGQQEQELYRQFEELCSYFYVWADSGSRHETDRSFKRMRTQVTLVQHHEAELESKRLHFIKVVEAFKMVARITNDDEHADPTTAVADKRRDVTKRPISHAAIVDAYDWDDLHPSRCVIL